ncbi:Nuclear receptor corepressor 2 [Nymphon striatum]|nr:Nuclear receptor corepressor 2 [Nymphon striatum]
MILNISLSASAADRLDPMIMDPQIALPLVNKITSGRGSDDKCATKTTFWISGIGGNRKEGGSQDDIVKPPHEGNIAYKHHLPPPHSNISPPLTGTRGYPYPQDPQPANSIHSIPSSTGPYVLVPPVPNVTAAYGTSIFKENPYQIPQSEYLMDGNRFNPDHRISPSRSTQLGRRPTLIPRGVEYADRDRYMETYGHPFEPVLAQSHGNHPTHLVMSSTNSLVAPANIVNASNVSVQNHRLSSGHHSNVSRDYIVNKRPRLSVEPKQHLTNNLNLPLMIETWPSVEVKKEPAYNPQVEAISPTLPEDSPTRSEKDELLASITRVDREIATTESQISNLKRKQQQLKLEAEQPADSKHDTLEQTEIKDECVVQRVYNENKLKAMKSWESLDKLGPRVEMPKYNQPRDTSFYLENRKNHLYISNNLRNYLVKKHKERVARDTYLTETYSKLYQQWIKKLEKKENSVNKRAKDQKVREYFEKQFPELKKQREDKERISRVGTRIRSDAEFEEIIDGLQEQEMEDKKMRSYAVVPPMLLDETIRKMCFENKNGLIEDPLTQLKDRDLINIWTEQEKEIFKEKFFQHPKNFGVIASFLERKSVSECVNYYYLTKAKENYKQIIKSSKKRSRQQFQKPQPGQQQHPTQALTNPQVTFYFLSF